MQLLHEGLSCNVLGQSGGLIWSKSQRGLIIGSSKECRVLPLHVRGIRARERSRAIEVVQSRAIVGRRRAKSYLEIRAAAMLRTRFASSLTDLPTRSPLKETTGCSASTAVGGRAAKRICERFVWYRPAARVPTASTSSRGESISFCSSCKASSKSDRTPSGIQPNTKSLSSTADHSSKGLPLHSWRSAAATRKIARASRRGLTSATSRACRVASSKPART